jgi:hypothetical protein
MGPLSQDPEWVELAKGKILYVQRHMPRQILRQILTA